ncbi:hypothetical protein Fot_02469 [Forsythia ovata]|uniref:Uncharacterized protein n=1 Tax=Forsythia ovata TaxID=205694 RepID=A0ABD1X6Y5_9LAMI
MRTIVDAANNAFPHVAAVDLTMLKDTASFYCGFSLVKFSSHASGVTYANANTRVSLESISLSTKADISFFIDGSFQIVEDLKSWAHTNTQILDDIISEKYYSSLTPFKLFVPNDKSKFTEIRSIRGLKSMQLLVNLRVSSPVNQSQRVTNQ